MFLGPLFEEGGETGAYLEFSVRSINPEAGPGGLGVDPLRSDVEANLAVKLQVTDSLSFALIKDQPFAVNTDYRPATSARGILSSTGFTAVLRQEFENGLSAHGGLRMLSLNGELAGAPGGNPALLDVSSDYDLGYLAGVAYERPDIALRVALTYNSEIDAELSGTENASAVALTTTTPDSINLEFQTGIAQDTLAFGTVRHAYWKGFNVTSPLGTYATLSDDTTAYSVGIGRRLNENWSTAVTLGYEAAGTRPGSTPLAPTTGTKSIGLGGTYTQGNTKISAGVTYAELGTQTVSTGTFNDNSAIGVGVRLGINF